MMSTTIIQSEYEPLIATNNNIHANNNNTVETTTTIKTYLYRAKIVLFSIVSLISAALIIYSMFASQQNHLAPAQTNWIQMEQSHTQSQHIPSAWTEKEECNEDHSFSMTLALKQEHTELLDTHIIAISDPTSITFHKYWDKNKVRSYFKPSQEALNTVLEWLSSSGFTTENKNLNMVSQYGNIIKISLTCAQANTLLNTKYILYENTDGLTHLHVQNGMYNIPDTIYNHIDFISPTIRFPLQHHTATMELISMEDITETYNIPERLYKLYLMTDSMSSIIGNVDSLDDSICRQSVLSAIQEYYNDEDLQSFWKYFNVFPQSKTERFPSTQPQGNGAEAELDTQYITSTGNGIYTYVYYMDDEEDPFISLSEAILSTDIHPFVVSMSYGANEKDLGEEYVTRANQEFGKLALIGITMFASSGDNGVRGDSNVCYDETTYRATFPAAATYVTSVGGTQGGIIPNNYEISSDEIAWDGSGGGFSQYFDAPIWQKKAIRSYFKQKDIKFPDESRYVSSGRGYPDISAQAVDFIINIDGKYYIVSGTSASSPTVAGMISMINYKRIKSGKSSLGFINPVLYSLYSKGKEDNNYFNDVVKGYNVGCLVDNNIGFYAADGWDPVTGIGTPRFTPLYQALLSIE